jgi:hypothetical protein
MRTSRSTALAIVGAFVLGGLAAATAFGWSRLAPPGGNAVHPVWTEVAWPFPMDQWGKGKAFRCSAADCGVEVKVYVRAKIGFCNCSTGVSDDIELDRISDFELFANAMAPLAPGREISVAWMKGRSRPFSIAGATPVSALSVGFNDRCDAIVATAVVGHDKPAALEPAVIAFLNSPPVIRWAELTLGL